MLDFVLTEVPELLLAMSNADQIRGNKASSIEQYYFKKISSLTKNKVSRLGVNINYIA